MAFLISARWPNGTYLGHRSDGTPEDLPTLSRVFSAIVHAAGTGSLAAELGEEAAPGFGRITSDSVTALRWLEEHPPVGMSLPAWPDFIPAHAAAAITGYRAEGVHQKEVGRLVYKKTLRTIGTASWIGGPVQWIWDDEPPAEVLAHLDGLCADVGTLGEGDSPAILEVEKCEDVDRRTHDLIRKSFFDPEGVSVSVPAHGRLDALERQFSSANPVKPPTLAKDKRIEGQGGLPQSESPTVECLAPMRLVPRQRSAADVPWDLAVVLPVSSGPFVADEDRVAVSVALHRALIAAIGQQCPPVVTGKYRKEDPPPANRVALHYLPPGVRPMDARQDQAHVVILLPRGMASTDMDQVHEGIARFRPLRMKIGLFEFEGPSVLPGDAFWSPPESDRQREWAIDPVAIPERKVKGSDVEDVIARTVAWSLGNVLRDIHAAGRVSTPAERLQWMVDQGAAVVEARQRWTADPARFVHRTNRTIPVMPYQARVRLGTLVPQTGVLALGQSRHLGGGLLVPVDRRVPKGETDG